MERNVNDFYALNPEVKEMMKVVVADVNQLFNSNYNLISFDTQPIEELLQLLCNTICLLGDYDKWVYKTNPEETIEKILRALRAVQYVPYGPDNSALPPEIFYQRLTEGHRPLIHHVLYFLMTHKESCTRNLYLARFMTEVPVPADLADTDIENLQTEYAKCRQVFWGIYKENKKLSQEVKVSEELKEDIDRMARDMGNLSLRTEQQREKVESVPQKAVYIEQAKQLRGETTQNKKLEEQLRETQEFITRISNVKDGLISSLSGRQQERKTYNTMVLSEQELLNVNKLMCADELPKELSRAEKELRLGEVIALEFVPHKEDLEMLELKVRDIEVNVKTLIEKKNLLSSTTEDKLGPYRNQAKVIANKKADVQKQVHQLKQLISEVEFSIEDKTRLMHEIVGGNILHGADLKVYVSSLRNTSNQYKMCRYRLQSISNELSVSTRTLDVLYLLDSGLEEEVKRKEKPTLSAMEVVDNVDELKQRCRKIKTEIEQQVLGHSYDRHDFVKINETLEGVVKTHKVHKEEYESATGNLEEETKRLAKSIGEIDGLVKEREVSWRNMTAIIDKYEKIIEKVNDRDNIPSTSTTPQSIEESLAEKIYKLEQVNKSLSAETVEATQIRMTDQTTMQVLNEMFNILQTKGDADEFTHVRQKPTALVFDEGLEKMDPEK